MLARSAGQIYIVTLTKPLTINDFPHGYFPRNFHYKRDAIALVEEVRRKGGEAKVEKFNRERV